METRSLCRIRMHEQCGDWEEGVCVSWTRWMEVRLFMLCFMLQQIHTGDKTALGVRTGHN